MLEDGSWIKYDYMCGDAMAEVIASRVLDVLKFEHIPYDFYQNEITTCISPNLLKEGESLITLHRYFVSRYDYQELEEFYNFIFRKGAFKERYQRLVEALHSHFGGLENENLLYQTFIADVVCLNSDRHLNNIAFIRSVDGRFRTCPIFDMGCSFLVGELVNLIHLDGLGVTDRIKKIQGGFALKPFFMNFRTIEKAENIRAIALSRENLNYILQQELENYKEIKFNAKYRLLNFLKE